MDQPSKTLPVQNLLQVNNVEKNLDLQKEPSQNVNKVQQEFEIPTIFNDSLQNHHVQQLNAKSQSIETESLHLILPQVSSRNVLIFLFMFTTISIFFFLFVILLRKEGNLIIPSAMIFQSLSFLFTPIFFIYKNLKLQKFTVSRLKNCVRNVKEFIICVVYFFKLQNNQVHPKCFS